VGGLDEEGRGMIEFGESGMVGRGLLIDMFGSGLTICSDFRVQEGRNPTGSELETN
jgi:hypothetical protein